MPFDLGKIGQLLKTARDEKGLTIEDVSAKLFIGKATLRAIEAGDWEKLPHIVYVKGYVTQYASFLGLAEAVKADLSPQEPEPAEKKREESTARREAIPMGRNYRKRIVSVAVTAGVLFAFLIFMNVQRPPHVARSPHAAPQVTQPAAAPAAATEAPSVSYNRQEAPAESREEKAAYQPAEERYQTVAGQDRTEGSYDARQEKIVLAPKKLMIACQERTWVAVMIDGSERKEFMLNPEEVVVLSANDKFDLLIGNAAGVKLYYNGKDVGLSGQSGQVKRVTLS